MEPDESREPGEHEEPIEKRVPKEPMEGGEPVKLNVQCEPTSQYRIRPSKKHAQSTHGDKTFISETDLTENNGENLSHCALCNKPFEETSSLRKHVRIHHSDVMPFQCDMCDERFTAKSPLTEHARTHHSEKPLHLDDDTYKAELNNAVENMLEKEGMDKPINTVIKLQKQTSGGNDVTQTSENKKVNRFECAQCKMIFRTEDRLLKHAATATHKSEQRYRCDVCGKSFKTETNLEQHKKTHSEKTPDFNYCIKEEPKDTFSSIDEPLATNIKSEMQAENNVSSEPGKSQKPGESPFQCDQCGKGFVAKSGLTEHMETYHFSVFTVTRRSCGKLTSVDILDDTVAKNLIAVSSVLNRHLRTQSIEKPHACSQCEKAFADRSNLTKHLRTHESSSDMIEVVSQSIHSNNSAE